MSQFSLVFLVLVLGVSDESILFVFFGFGLGVSDESVFLFLVLAFGLGVSDESTVTWEIHLKNTPSSSGLWYPLFP